MRLLTYVVSLLGILGTVLCIGSVLGVWYAEVRIDRARKQLFEGIDQSLSRIDGRVVEIQKLAGQSKVTIEEVQQRARELTRKEARDRLAERFEVEVRIEKLAAGLQQADSLLEISHESVQQIRQALELGSELGFPLQADSVDPLLQRIADVKNELQTAIDAVASLSSQTGKDDNSETPIAKMEQIATLAARLLATFGTIDARFDSLRGRLTDARDAIGKLNAKTHARLVAAAIGATLFLMLMGAGQVCLWQWARKTRSASTGT
jgi:hypothetical protein